MELYGIGFELFLLAAVILGALIIILLFAGGDSHRSNRH